MALQRAPVGPRSEPRGVYRSIYEIGDIERSVIVYRIEHRAPPPTGPR